MRNIHGARARLAALLKANHLPVVHEDLGPRFPSQICLADVRYDANNLYWHCWARSAVPVHEGPDGIGIAENYDAARVC